MRFNYLHLVGRELAALAQTNLTFRNRWIQYSIVFGFSSWALGVKTGCVFLA